MAHLKKYWWAYALLLVVIIWGTRRPNCLRLGGACPNNFELALDTFRIKKSTNGNNAESICPPGKFAQYSIIGDFMGCGDVPIES